MDVLQLSCLPRKPPNSPLQLLCLETYSFIESFKSTNIVHHFLRGLPIFQLHIFDLDFTVALVLSFCQRHRNGMNNPQTCPATASKDGPFLIPLGQSDSTTHQHALLAKMAPSSRYDSRTVRGINLPCQQRWPTPPARTVGQYNASTCSAKKDCSFLPLRQSNSTTHQPALPAKMDPSSRYDSRAVRSINLPC